MLQNANRQVAYGHEPAANSSLGTECICGARMRLRVVQPHLLANDRVDVWLFECDECRHELRMLRPV
jgi:hypothetical protein